METNQSPHPVESAGAAAAVRLCGVIGSLKFHFTSQSPQIEAI